MLYMKKMKKQLEIDYSKEEVIYIVEKYNKIINETINIYENELSALKSEDFQKLQRRIEEIENSKSWKITEPLRKCTLFLKTFRKRFKF